MRKVQVRLPDDVADKLVAACDRYGLTLSQLGGMALQSGLDTILRAVAPMESLSADQLRKLMLAVESEENNAKALLAKSEAPES